MKSYSMLSLLIFIACTSGAYSVGGGNSCAEVRRTFVSKRIGPLKMVPSHATAAKNLQVCSNSEMSCCNRKMERKYQQRSSRGVIDILHQKISGFKLHLTRFEEEFEAHLTETITKSRADTFQKLNATFYDVTDVQFLNTIIDDIYDGILIAKDDLTLNEVITQLELSVLKFFQTLFALIVQQQGSVQLGAEEFKCVASQSGILAYYDVFPNLIKAHLITSLNQTSALVRGLEHGVKSVSISTRSYVDKECQKALVKMQYCSHCYGLTLIKPCRGLCLNVMRGCLVGLSETDLHWHRYVAALAASVRNMTEGGTDLESVLAEISTRLDSVSSMLIPKYAVYSVKQTCGLPVERVKRSPSTITRFGQENPSSSLNDHKMSSSLRRHRHQQRRNRRTHLRLKSGSGSFRNLKVPRKNLPPPHEMLIGDSPLPIKISKKKSRKEDEEIKNTKIEEDTLNPETEDLPLKSKLKRFVTLLNFSSNFFLNLPDQFCDATDDMSLPVSTLGHCWDGTKVSEKYILPIPGVGLENQYSNPELKVTQLHPDVLHSMQYMHMGGKQMFFNDDKVYRVGIFDDYSTISTGETTTPHPPGEDDSKRRTDAPCSDDEDDCAELGSAGSGEDVEKKKSHVKSKGVAKPEVPNGSVESDVLPISTISKVATSTSTPDFSKSLSNDMEQIMELPSVNAAESNNGQTDGKGRNSAEGIRFRGLSWRTFFLELLLLHTVKKMIL